MFRALPPHVNDSSIQVRATENMRRHPPKLEKGERFSSLGKKRGFKSHASLGRCLIVLVSDVTEKISASAQTTIAERCSRQ